MAKKRVRFVLEVDLDPTPGAFHTTDDAQYHLQMILGDRIAHYNPILEPLTQD